MEEADALALGQQYAALFARFEGATEALTAAVRGVCARTHLPIESIESRAKSVESLVAKLRTRTDVASLDSVTDKIGVRVVTRYRGDVPAFIDIIRQNFEVINSWDHGAQDPGSFGYVSSHLLLRVPPPNADFVAEVQVRSILQHAWSIISHSLDYKSEVDLPSSARRRLYRVAALLEAADETFDFFRTDVQQAHEVRRTEVRADDLASISLDLRSLREASTALPLDDIVSAAVSTGWGRVRAKKTADKFLSRLIDIAGAAGIADLAELSGFATRAIGDAEWLRSIAAEFLDTMGWLPSPIPTDIVALRIIGERPTDMVRAAANRSHLHDTLVDVALRAMSDHR